MRLKARSGQGGRQGYSPLNRTVRNAKETASTCEQELAAEWFLAAIHEAVLRERLERELGSTEHQGVSSGRKRRGRRLARCVSTGRRWSEALSLLVRRMSIKIDAVVGLSGVWTWVQRIKHHLTLKTVLW